MGLLNKAKVVYGLAFILILSVMASCARLTTPVIPLTGPTATPTRTATASTSLGSSLIWDDFDEIPWTGWTNTGANSYLVSTYTQNATFNSGALNTTTHQAGSASLDLNVTFTSATSNLLEATIDSGAVYGSPVNEQTGGVNPSHISFWINTTTAIQVTKVYVVLGGTYYVINNVVNCPANTWTNVVAGIPGTIPAMNAVQSVAVDMTCATAATVDVRIDTISFLPPSTTVTPTATGTSTPMAFTPTGTITPTSTPVVTATITPTLAATPTSNYEWDNFDAIPWANPIPSYLYGPVIGGAYEQNCTDTVTYSISGNHNGSAGAILDSISFNAASPLEEICFYNGDSYGANVNVYSLGGAQPNYVSAWFYADNPVVINKFYIYQGGNIVINTAPLPVVIPAGAWTNVAVPCPATPTFSAVAYVMFDISSPASVVSFPYTANVKIDDIYFYH